MFRIIPKYKFVKYCNTTSKISWRLLPEDRLGMQSNRLLPSPWYRTGKSDHNVTFGIVGRAHSLTRLFPLISISPFFKASLSASYRYNNFTALMNCVRIWMLWKQVRLFPTSSFTQISLDQTYQDWFHSFGAILILNRGYLFDILTFKLGLNRFISNKSIRDICEIQL